LSLKSNIYFHDGTLLKADHVKFSIEYQKNNCYLAPIFKLINNIIIHNDSTLSIWLKNPYAPFLYALASPSGILISSLNKTIKLGNTTHFSGTGPYQIKSWDKNNRIELEYFEGYRNPCVSVVKIIYTYNPNSIDMEKTIHEKGIDILYLVTGFYIDRLIWLGQYDYYTQKSASTFFLGFNVTDSILNNIKIRQALLYAINTKKLVMNIQRGNSILAVCALPPIYANLYTNAQEQYDTSKVNSLLKSSGIKDHLKLRLYINTEQYVRQTFLELLKKMFSESNITLDIIKFNDWNELIKVKPRNSIQLFDGAWQDDLIGDAHNFLYTLFHSKSEWNFFNLKDEKIDRWLDLAAQEFNDNLRNEYYKKINARVLELTPAIFLHHVIPHFAYNKKKIKKMVVNPYGIVQYHLLELY
jgi:peptide/nickel transport system substrate-binding protein